MKILQFSIDEMVDAVDSSSKYLGARQHVAWVLTNQGVLNAILRDPLLKSAFINKFVDGEVKWTLKGVHYKYITLSANNMVMFTNEHLPSLEDVSCKPHIGELLAEDKDGQLSPYVKSVWSYYQDDGFGNSISTEKRCWEDPLRSVYITNYLGYCNGIAREYICCYGEH